jgi:molybdenum cofactor synthesis domain-containing protein
VERTTAALLVVGNELLSGKVRDQNAHLLATELFSMGVALRRIVVVPDEIGETVEALRDLLTRVDFVFTSGGIGPTHDDITVAAVAKALGRPLEEHPTLVRKARAIFGDRLGEEHRRMTRVPAGCTLVESEATRWPALVVDRVFVLAGVPEIFRRSLAAVRHLIPERPAALVASVYLLTDEWSLTPLLDRAVAAFPDVLIGSYPEIGNAEYRVRVTFEAVDRELVAEAVDYLVQALPGKVLVRRD